jgi:hypothetical protein
MILVIWEDIRISKELGRAANVVGKRTLARSEVLKSGHYEEYEFGLLFASCWF